MTETIASAPVAPASAVPSSTPVVVAAVHQSIVASLEADLSLAYNELATAWKTKNVVIVAAGAFALGFVVHFIL